MRKKNQSAISKGRVGFGGYYDKFGLRYVFRVVSTNPGFFVKTIPPPTFSHFSGFQLLPTRSVQKRGVSQIIEMMASDWTRFFWAKNSGTPRHNLRRNQ